jgi:hypothetical protein
MNDPIRFPNNNQVPLVGQPFTLISAYVPMHMTLSCNCGGVDTQVAIVASVAAACPSCARTFNAAFNPTTNQVQMQIGIPKADEKVPS